MIQNQFSIWSGVSSEIILRIWADRMIVGPPKHHLSAFGLMQVMMRRMKVALMVWMMGHALLQGSFRFAAP